MIKRGLIAIALIFSGSIGATLTFGSIAYADADCDQKGMILTLKPWYYGLTSDTDCSIVSPSELGQDGMQIFVTRIILTVVEDLLQLVGYATVGFIIYGGFIYMTSSGAPDRASKGAKTILNAVIGLVIAMASIALVNFIGGTVMGIPT